MKKFFKHLSLSLTIFLIILLTSCSLFPREKKNPDTEHIQSQENNLASSFTPFETFTTTLAMKEISSSPLDATFNFGDLNSLGLSHLLSELDTIDQESFNQAMDLASWVIEELEHYDLNDLSHDQELTYEMLYFQYHLQLQMKDYYYYDNLIQPTSGIQINLPLALMQIELKSEEDVAHYLSRTHQLSTLIEQVIVYEKAKANEGFLLPQDLYDDVIDQIDALLVEPEDFLMVQNFSERLDSIDMPADKKESYLNQYLNIVQEEIYPSYKNLRTAIEEYKKLSTNDHGLASWKGGKEYYQLIIKNKTSYDLSAEELLDWAKTEQSKSVSTLVNLYNGSPSVQSIETFSEIFPSYDSLDDIYTIENQSLDDLFYDYKITPASENVIPSYLEEHLASGFYFPISLDGLAYGNMFLSQKTYDHIDFQTLNLYFHENVPGHHLYFSRIADMDMPLIRKLTSWLPYEEGWAIYMEQYAYNYINNDPDIVTFLKANDHYFAYQMIISDIQYHYYGDSRETIIDSLTSEGYSRESILPAVNRMVANPGELIHYYFGAYKINGYLAQAQKALGDDFDIKAFHDFILNHAGLPFTTTDHTIEEWINEQE